MVPHPGRRIPKASASEFIESAVPMELQWPALGIPAKTISISCRPVIRFSAKLSARFPKHQARAAQLAVHIGIEHRSARKHDGRQVHRGRGHQGCGCGLVASCRKHDAIEWISGQYLNQAKVGQVTVKGCGGAAARLLDGMRGKFEGQSPSIADTRLHPFGEGDVNPIARDQVAATLCNANDQAGRIAAPHG